MSESSQLGKELVPYDAAALPYQREEDNGIRNQLVLTYFVLKLCKTKGLNMNCFWNVMTKLYALAARLTSRLDHHVLNVSCIPHRFLSKIELFQDPIDDIIDDLKTDPFVKELVGPAVRGDS